MQEVANKGVKHTAEKCGCASVHGQHWSNIWCVCVCEFAFRAISATALSMTAKSSYIMSAWDSNNAAIAGYRTGAKGAPSQRSAPNGSQNEIFVEWKSVMKI